MLSSLKLFFDSIHYRLRRLKEYLRDAWHYYGNRTFRNADIALVLNYFWTNPYHISRLFAEQKGELNVHTYGETPLTVLETISKGCGITENDTVYELGCGRGKSCFWFKTILKCQRVVGIDYNPYFIRTAQRIAKKFGIAGVEFRCEDLLHTHFEGATLVYIYGSTWDDDFIERLASRLRELAAGARIISISYPLTDYTHTPLFELKNAFHVDFTWGPAMVYEQVRTSE